VGSADLECTFNHCSCQKKTFKRTFKHSNNQYGKAFRQSFRRGPKEIFSRPVDSREKDTGAPVDSWERDTGEFEQAGFRLSAGGFGGMLDSVCCNAFDLNCDFTF
jgi:hypothetical protein